ncbi:hypothetical protein OHQ88_33945 (plasmid) [Micromonospora zamorensis]|uniref:hypothetical protein n=1 Tax=Micromonospora zamorensis TaxID=709883 RepID=UPI002E1D648F
MSPQNLIAQMRRRWRYRNVTSLADLADLLSTRRRAAYPDCRTMNEALVALGRAGFVVVDAEQGGAAISTPDGLLTRRASVAMFASAETWDWLDDVLYRSFPSLRDTPYIVRVYEMFAPGRESFTKGWRQGGVPVSRIDDRDNRIIGDQMDPEQVRRLFPVRAGVQQELHNGWLLTVHDKQWGSSNLFEFLLNAATDRQVPVRL